MPAEWHAPVRQAAGLPVRNVEPFTVVRDFHHNPELLPDEHDDAMEVPLVADISAVAKRPG